MTLFQCNVVLKVDVSVFRKVRIRAALGIKKLHQDVSIWRRNAWLRISGDVMNRTLEEL